MVISDDPNENWMNDDIQFPRLLAELEAAGAFTTDVTEALGDSMDLPLVDIFDIVDRAGRVWDEIKENT